MILTIAPPIWRMPQVDLGKIIIALDRQKPWERVIDYGNRIILLFRARKMTEQYDYQFMSRVFLGGLNKKILDIVLDDGVQFSFRAALNQAQATELALQRNDAERMDEDDDESDEDGYGVQYTGGMTNGVGAGREGIYGIAQPKPKPYIIQEGEEIYGEPNERVDRLFNAHYVLILYR